MLKRLRLQLAFLYILAAIGLVALFGLGSYVLLQLYFQRETDLALQYKMALQFRQYGLTPPAELLRVEQNWQASNSRPASSPTPSKPTLSPVQSDLGEDSEDEEKQTASPSLLNR